MLSYRHGFHAGNHADVLKHVVLTLVVDYLKQKEKPFWYIDTHAGAGAYALDSAEAVKNAEFTTGIERLLVHRAELPLSLQPYLAAIDTLREASARSYPGSPLFAAYSLREQDRLRLFELHPQDFDILKNNFARDRRTIISQSDGFSALKALLPPPSRRALVLIDPPYELKDDYDRVIGTLNDALRRFATGTYLVWYPLLPRRESQQLPLRLQASAENTLRIELQIKEAEGEFGMYGSGIFAINPPWRLQQQMQEILPVLTQCLAQSPEAKFLIEGKNS